VQSVLSAARHIRSNSQGILGFVFVVERLYGHVRERPGTKSCEHHFEAYRTRVLKIGYALSMTDPFLLKRWRNFTTGVLHVGRFGIC
jgi:hypothetical protein